MRAKISNHAPHVKHERQMANMHLMHVLYPHMLFLHEGIYKRWREKDEKTNVKFLREKVRNL